MVYWNIQYGVLKYTIWCIEIYNMVYWSGTNEQDNEIINFFYAIEWYDMLRYDFICSDKIWYDEILGIIWYDMIWYDMIWYDMMWYDTMWDNLVFCIVDV